MPQTEVRIFQDHRQRSPFLEWLTDVQKLDRKGYIRILAAIRDLQTYGYELDRPTAAFLRDGIYELRIRVKHVHYRVLYGFIDQNVACISHGFGKKDAKVDPKEIDKAIERVKLAESDPDKYTVVWSI
jgi:phage-related protein